jgi:hypothetical protein
MAAGQEQCPVTGARNKLSDVPQPKWVTPQANNPLPHNYAPRIPTFSVIIPSPRQKELLLEPPTRCGAWDELRQSPSVTTPLIPTFAEVGSLGEQMATRLGSS